VGRAPALEEEGARVELQELGENDASVLPQALADRLDVELPFIEKAIGDLEVVEILLLVGGDLVRREELRLDQQVGQATRRVSSAPRDETEGGVLDEDLRDRVVMDEGQNAGEIAVADEAEKAHHVKDAQIAAKRDGRGIVPWLGRDDAREEALMGVLEARGGVGVAR